MVPLIRTTLPDLSSVRVWIGAGDQDPIIPRIRSPASWWNFFAAAGADVTVRFCNAGHGLTDDDGQHDWLGELNNSTREKLWLTNRRRRFLRECTS